MAGYRGSSALLVPLMLPARDVRDDNAGEDVASGVLWLLQRSWRPSARPRLVALAIVLPIVVVAGALLLVLLLTAPL